MNNSTPVIEEYKQPLFKADDPGLTQEEPITCWCGCGPALRAD